MVQPSQQFDMEEPLLRRPGMPVGAAIRLVAQPRDGKSRSIDRRWRKGSGLPRHLTAIPARLHIGGHSSSGYLCAVALITDWPAEFDLPADAIKAGDP